MQKRAFTKQKVIISPQNNNSDSTFSATSFPQIQFVLSGFPGLADFKTLRLNYTYEIVNSGDLPPVNTPAVADANNRNGIANSNRVGTASAISQVNVSTGNGRNIETINNFNRYLATIAPQQMNQFDFINTFQGNDPTISTKSVGGARQLNVPVQVSTPIRTGFLSNSTPVNLSQKGIHGCIINILLDMNQNVIGPYFIPVQDDSATNSLTPVTAGVVGTENFKYKLKNVFLSYDVYVPSDEVYSSMPSSGQMTFNTINSMQSTLLSNDQTLTLRTGIKNLISVTHSLIASVHTNNLVQDGMALERLTVNPQADTSGTAVPLNTAQYFKGGSLFPYNSVLDSSAQALVDNPQSQIIQPAVDSVTLYDSDDTIVNPMTSTQGLNTSQGFSAQQKALPPTQTPDPNSNFVLGVPFDLSQQGVNFSKDDYAIRLQSGLNGLTPFQFGSYFRCRNVLQYSPNGVEVLE